MSYTQEVCFNKYNNHSFHVRVTHTFNSCHHLNKCSLTLSWTNFLMNFIMKKTNFCKILSILSAPQYVEGYTLSVDR